MRRVIGAALLGITLLCSGALAQSLSLSSTRMTYAISEPVEFSMPAGTLVVTHTDGSSVSIDVPANDGAGGARLVSIKPNTLKPGQYTATLKGDGAATPVTFIIAPAESANAYWVGQWVHHGGTKENAIAKGGWMYMNTDYVSLHPRKPAPGDITEGYVAAASKPFALMVLGGGHQLDLDMPNDWGDPWVQRAIIWRTQLASLSDRIYPIAGLHIFDEPGLTWWPIPGGPPDKDGKPTNKGASPLSIPHQIDEFKKNTGKDMPFGTFNETLPQYKPMMPDWLAFMEMRMKYLGQAWYASVWGTESVNPAFLTVNQVSSSYAPHDTTDGVDSRQNKPYKVLSGHAQYSDLPFGTLQPLRAAESYQGFSWDRPHVYLPMWYTHNWATIRNAVWVSYASKLEGMWYTPEQDFALNNGLYGFLGTMGVFEIAETNRKMAMVGGAMSQLRKTLSPVMILQSNTQAAWDIAEENYPEVVKVGTPPYVSKHREAVNACFFRVLETGMIPNTVDEIEAVEKGVDFLKQWPVIFCPALTYATPEFQKVLEGYVASGGKLIQVKGDALIIKGSIIADHTFASSGEYYATNILENQKKAADAKKAGDAAGEAAAMEAAMKAGTDLAWRKWNNAGAPNFLEELKGWIGKQRFTCTNPNVLMGVHSDGNVSYLLLANNAQSLENPRTVKHELVPAVTTIVIPAGGVVYDAFNCGKVTLERGEMFNVKLASGDGACFIYLPADPGPPQVEATLAAGDSVNVTVTWGTLLPFRIRIMDPSGATVGDYFRATGQQDKAAFMHAFPLGANAQPGKWTIRVDEWLTGTTKDVAVEVPPAAPIASASVDNDNVSIYFDDAQRISKLLTGTVDEPPFAELNWDFKRVWNVDAKKFAIFAPADKVDAANKLAEALKAKGMTVEVNPAYKIDPFVREPNRGGAGPKFREENFENIYANAIVLPGHELLEKSTTRGHINHLITPTFPGPRRAYIQWGSSCYQAGYQDIFVMGDFDAGVAWLTAAINGQAAPATMADLNGTVTAPTVPPAAMIHALSVAQEIKVSDTPVGVGTNADGSVTYVAGHGGNVCAYDASGKQLWDTPVLLEAWTMAVSPKGDRIAIAGYPGIVVLDGNGKILDGYRLKPVPVGNPMHSNRIISVAWNDAGTRVAAGWANNAAPISPDPQPVIILDADGKQIAAPKIAGNTFGVAFVPKTDTLLVGSDQLTAVNAADGATLWTNPIRGAQSFAFSKDGKTAAAGGWGTAGADPKIPVGVFNLADGVVTTTAMFDAVIGGIAFTPDNKPIVAVWGGTHPLYVIEPQQTPDPASKITNAKPFFASKFGFQNVMWSDANAGLVAAEEGGRLWIIGADGKPQAQLDDAGTTAYRMIQTPAGIVVGRMNRVVQKIAAK